MCLQGPFFLFSILVLVCVYSSTCMQISCTCLAKGAKFFGGHASFSSPFVKHTIFFTPFLLLRSKHGIFYESHQRILVKVTNVYWYITQSATISSNLQLCKCCRIETVLLGSCFSLGLSIHLVQYVYCTYTTLTLPFATDFQEKIWYTETIFLVWAKAKWTLIQNIFHVISIHCAHVRIASSYSNHTLQYI